MATISTKTDAHWNYFLSVEADLERLSRFIEFDYRNNGTFQIPVDSSQETSGGSRMLNRKPHCYDSSTSPTNQRQHDEVYQTPRFRSPHAYRDCQTGLVVPRRLRENDANRPLLSDLQDLPLSTHFSGQPTVGDAVQR